MSIALLSVADKSKLPAFAEGLSSLGWEFIASGGTAKLLRENKIDVKEVADYTGYPEILGGRVKTLHPAVHGGILSRENEADTADLEKISAKPIDLIAVNLYPFRETIARPNVTLEEAIEKIDIGGVALLRAAAKNFQRVTVIVDTDDYDLVLKETSPETRRRLAVKAFAHTQSYDAAISAYLAPGGALNVPLFPIQELRYGENPHQSALLYGFSPEAGPMGGELLQGKPLSYNNLLDLDAAWRAAISFERPTVCIVKHLSPCGLASAETLAAAYDPALASDPVSAFGSVIAVNREFDLAVAKKLGKLFVECIIAPGFSKDAAEVLSKKGNLRLLRMPSMQLDPDYELRSVNAGILRQDIDMGDPPKTDWRVATKREPSEEEWTGLRFAWKACQHVKSNAIVFSVGEATVGIGGGQPNRVDCVRIAATRAGDKSKGAVMASDAFFPFPDSVEEAAKYGITAIVQPGGSVRDDQSIEACDRLNIAMVFTGVRHFRH
jgi:phosphoribosylaminoimidazolecarboxamide formyltransferase/IMP cyclohydrolase